MNDENHLRALKYIGDILCGWGDILSGWGDILALMDDINNSMEDIQMTASRTIQRLEHLEARMDAKDGDGK